MEILHFRKKYSARRIGTAAMIPLLIALALMPLMVTNQSFWLDEGDTGIYAIQPDFSSWLQHLTSDRNADCQMPLTMLSSWLVGIGVGASEWTLRAQNLLFGGIALLAMAAIARRTGLRWLPLLMAIQPFFWFYMDQARPYAAQIAGGTLLAWVLSHVCTDEKVRGKWLLAFSFTAFIAFTTSMLMAAAIGVVFIGCIVWGGLPQWDLVKKQVPSMALLWGLSVALAAYFAWTIIRGAEGTRIWEMDWKALGFIGYELMGCLGLGPSLDDIRVAAKAGGVFVLLSRLALPGLLLGSAAALASSYYLSRFPRSYCEKSHLRACLLVVFVVSVLMVVTSIAIHKPLWARHLSSIFPFLVCLEGYWIRSALSSRHLFLRGLAVFFIALLVTSSLSVRFSPFFAKDDYRRAAEIAKNALSKGEEVWWSAAEYTAMFYQVPLDTRGNAAFQAVRVPRQIPSDNMKALPPPDVIIVTRSEVYDQSLHVKNFISRHAYHIVESPRNFLIYAKTVDSRQPSLAPSSKPLVLSQLKKSWVYRSIYYAPQESKDVYAEVNWLLKITLPNHHLNKYFENPALGHL